jgi:hypothetical protein
MGIKYKAIVFPDKCFFPDWGGQTTDRIDYRGSITVE